ncbi:MAG TPA: YqgE/AlgH family protein [Acidimicrobiales bacterium]|nr:YqgE/AlgH family protein [Acidimicrobiales bacterium]
MSDTETLAGKLLIAEPTLHAAAFHRTVTLMLEHTDDGALGVVLDRPSDTSVTEVLPQWTDRVAAPGVVFSGGPVSPEVAICLGERDDVGEADGWQVAVGHLGTLDVSRSPDELPADVGRVRIFSGYAGWSAGQLEGELEAGAWYVVERLDDDCFSTDPNELWSRVLRRQPGRLAAVGLYPADPSVN